MLFQCLDLFKLSLKFNFFFFKMHLVMEHFYLILLEKFKDIHIFTSWGISSNLSLLIISYNFIYLCWIPKTSTFDVFFCLLLSISSLGTLIFVTLLFFFRILKRFLSLFFTLMTRLSVSSHCQLDSGNIILYFMHSFKCLMLTIF